ncbi:MAG: amino acid permease [Burkholderiales bacterium]|nr:amino acid permease [Phycisphaerae bacterium]
MTEKGSKPEALALLSSERPRNLGSFGAAGLLFGDWGTSRLYVLGLAFLVAGRTSFTLICMMSLLILAVAWAYSQICRLYPEGGGVYSAARAKHPLLGVLAALLLFADYTVTASLSALEAFHYFGLETTITHDTDTVDAGSEIVTQDSHKEDSPEVRTPLLKTAAFWAIVAIVAVGAVNMLGPKHSSGLAMVVAAAMILITLLIVIFALPQIDWRQIHWGTFELSSLSDTSKLWHAFVAIVLALSGVEAIASLTGVMKKPVYRTASRAIWMVAFEVAVFNILLGLVMLSIYPLDREKHTADMLAHMAYHYTGAWGEWPVRILGGLLLLSATNTAIGALMGLLYVMSRDTELPRVLQKLNGFGAPWLSGIIASAVPIVVLIFVNNVEGLSHLYAIGIVGAVAINCVICSFHARLRRYWRRSFMLMIGVLLSVIWITIAIDKTNATIFVGIVLVLGFGLRFATKHLSGRRAKPSLLRQAFLDQLTPEAMLKPRILMATAGGSQLAEAACEQAQKEDSALVVAFVREVALNYKVEGAARMTLDNDPAAQALYVDFLEAGHRHNVPIIPAYDTGTNAPEMLAELAALNGVSKLIIGTSRRGTLHQIIKGSFQRKLESLLGPDTPVEVLAPK